MVVRRDLLAAVLACALLTGPLAAQENGGAPTPGPTPPVTPDGTWNVFGWSGLNFNDEGAFTFSGSAVLDVMDAFIDGDRFEVYDHGVLVGTTSVPTDTGSSIFGDPDAALANPSWSSGSFNLGPGSHSITLLTISTATGFESGAGFLRATAGVPTVPRAGLLLLVVVLLVGPIVVLRRRAG